MQKPLRHSNDDSFKGDTKINLRLKIQVLRDKKTFLRMKKQQNDFIKNGFYCMIITINLLITIGKNLFR